jgi:hypothetical protein
MAALTSARNTPEMADGGRVAVYPVEANTKIYLGSMVALNAAGNAAPAATATGLKAIGRAEAKHGGTVGENADNTGGAAGAVSVVARRGVFLYANAGADAVAAGDVGKVCFVVDDNTVAKSNGTGTRSAAGRVAAIDPAGGVWVDFWHQSAAQS